MILDSTKDNVGFHATELIIKNPKNKFYSWGLKKKITLNTLI
jgi:hypothetical protein